jgi:hypothetical protein
MTDGYGVSIVKRCNAAGKGAGKKRKKGEKRKTRDAELFFFNTIERTELRSYQDIVFIDPNLRDTLFMMHKDSNRTTPHYARYTSMTRRRHLGTNITRDRTERYIKHQHNVDEIRLRHDNLSHTISHSISSADFDIYCSERGEAKKSSVPFTNNRYFGRCDALAYFRLVNNET